MATMLSVTVIYHILRDRVGATPIVLFLFWLLGAVLGPWAVLRWGRASRRPSSRRGLLIWLALWLAVGGFGFGNVFFQHFRCRAAAASGKGQVVQGTVTAYHPEDPDKRENRETLSVAGQTWTYYSAGLGSGGYRGVPSARTLIKVGSF